MFELFEKLNQIDDNKSLHFRLTEHFNPEVICINKINGVVCNNSQDISANYVCDNCGADLREIYINSILDPTNKNKLIFNNDTVSIACSEDSGKNGPVVHVTDDFIKWLEPTIHKDTKDNSLYGAFRIKELTSPLKEIIIILKNIATNSFEKQSLSKNSDQIKMDVD